MPTFRRRKGGVKNWLTSLESRSPRFTEQKGARPETSFFIPIVAMLLYGRRRKILRAVRTFYVGITRAKENLFLVEPESSREAYQFCH